MIKHKIKSSCNFLTVVLSLVFSPVIFSMTLLKQDSINQVYKIRYSEDKNLPASKMPQQYFEILRNNQIIEKLQGMYIKFQKFDDSPTFIVTSTYTGGAHCCSKLLIFTFGDELKKVALPSPFNNEANEPHQFFSWNQNKNSSDKLTITTQDPHWHYWRTYYADSAAPAVFWGFDGKKLQLDITSLKQAMPSAAKMKTNAQTLYRNIPWQEFIEKAKDLPKNEIPYPGAITGGALTLLYAGRPDLAREFIELAWNSAYPYKENFIRDLNSELNHSLYWQALEKMGFQKLS